MFTAPSLVDVPSLRPLKPAAGLRPRQCATSGLDLSLLTRVRNAGLHTRLNFEARRAHARLQALHRDPWPMQQRLLSRILSVNARTTFGVQHGFATIRDYARYVRQVPVMDHADLQDWMRYRREQDGAAPGRGGEALALPLDPTNSTSAIRSEIVYQHALAPAAFEGDLLILSASRARHYTAACAPLGGKQVIPPDIAGVSASDHGDLLPLRLALGAPGVTYVQATDAAELLRWTRLLEHQHRHLFKALRRGEWFPDGAPPEALRSATGLPLRPLPERAQALASLRALRGPLALGDLWPHVKLIALTQRSALDELLCAQWPQAHLIILGREDDRFTRLFTLPHVGDSRLPAADRYFFEFAVTDSPSTVKAPVCTLNNVKAGETYELVISHDSGLFRYKTGDQVRILGRVEGLPVLQRIESTHPTSNSHSAHFRIAA